MPDQQLASMIASIVEQKLATFNSASNLPSSSTSGAVLTAQQHLPGITSLEPDPSLLPVRNGGQQQTLSSVDFSLSSSQQDLNLGTPEDAALLHTNYRVPSIASHLSNSCITAITNGIQTLQAPSMVTCASTSTKGFPAPTPPAPTLTNATRPDALQPTQERTTLTPQALDPPSQRLAAQAIPAKATIEYLSKLSPTTPMDLPQLALYLHDHPDRAFVDAVLTGLSQGFKIGFQGPRVLISAKQNPHIKSTNLLKELWLGHTAGPFVSPPFPSFQVYPIGVIPKKHSTEWRTIFHLSFPKHQTTRVNSHIRPTDYSLHYITIDTAISIIQNIGKLGASCPSWTSSQPSVISQCTHLTGSSSL
ncbi:uncharacterized protein [Montipora capricornis]|uniref:uncharacterized protein isoform X1 n=1 Tax=Montipora capricornis TaxID=246305 RepID=UPI0035F10BAB